MFSKIGLLVLQIICDSQQQKISMTPSKIAHIVTFFVNQKGDTVSPKKLQKLLYYVEAWHLVHFDSPIIDEEFQAWVHGPVLPTLYHELKAHGYNDLEVVAEENDTIDEEIQKIIAEASISEDQLDLIHSVLGKYARLNSLQLELLTHSEAPWIEARNGCPPHEPCKNIISKERMKNFYVALIGEDEKGKKI